MISLTTDSVPIRDRTEFWADLVSRHVTPIRIEPGGAHPVRGEIHACAVGGFGISRVSGQGVRASHTRGHIARAGSHVYSVCVHVEGQARITRDREMLVLQPGDIFITDSRHPFTLDLERPWHHLLITLPTMWLDARVEQAGWLAGAVLRDRPLARLWANHLAAGFALVGELSTGAAALFGRHSLDLLAQMVNESQAGPGNASEAARAAIFLSARRLIALKFSDPNLTPAAIARDIGVSSRTLARAFAARNQTVMRQIFDERVDQAANLLASPQGAYRTVTDIAFACGFNDLSHFGRVFFRKLQMTPSQWRRRAS